MEQDKTRDIEAEMLCVAGVLQVTKLKSLCQQFLKCDTMAM